MQYLQKTYPTIHKIASLLSDEIKNTLLQYFYKEKVEYSLTVPHKKDYLAEFLLVIHIQLSEFRSESTNLSLSLKSDLKQWPQEKDKSYTYFSTNCTRKHKKAYQRVRWDASLPVMSILVQPELCQDLQGEDSHVNKTWN